MPIRVGDTLRQVNNSTIYPVVQATEVQVVDTAGNFAPPSIRSYKDLESVLAELATSSGGAGAQFTANYTNSLLAEGDAVSIVSADTVDRADATNTEFPAVGFCTMLDTPAAGQCTVQVAGSITYPGILTTSERYILSTSPGAIIAENDSSNSTYPGTGNFSQLVGLAISTTKLLIQIDNIIAL